ncbi:tetratricopeptide repeat protein [Viscerimonas tarda]
MSFFTLLFTSCSALKDSLSMFSLVIIFGLLIFLSSAMFFYVARKKKKANNNLASFSADVHNLLARIKSPSDKIAALKQLIERIENDEAYNKTPAWKEKVLSKVYEHLSAVYYGIGEESGVIEACTQVIALDSGNGMAYYNRGSMYNNQAAYEKALADFNEAAELMPDNAGVYNNRGVAQDNLGMYDEALSDFDYAISLEASAITYYNRANLHYEQKRFAEAKQDYTSYLELDPSDSLGFKRDVEIALQLIEKKLQAEKPEL